MLALSTATAYAVPFEDWLVDAELVRSTNMETQKQHGTFRNVLSWSGVHSADRMIYWMVITPTDPALPLVFPLVLGISVLAAVDKEPELLEVKPLHFSWWKRLARF